MVRLQFVLFKSFNSIAGISWGIARIGQWEEQGWQDND